MEPQFQAVIPHLMSLQQRDITRPQLLKTYQEVEQRSQQQDKMDPHSRLINKIAIQIQKLRKQ